MSTGGDMRLNYWIAIGILLCSFVFKLTGICMNGKTFDLEIGGYLSEEYIEKLLKSKSPQVSENVNGIFARVEKGKKYFLAFSGFLQKHFLLLK
jgi:hypothetical protein